MPTRKRCARLSSVIGALTTKSKRQSNRGEKGLSKVSASDPIRTSSAQVCCAAKSRSDFLRRTQHTCCVIEQLVDRHSARDQFLLVTEVDDDLQYRPARFDTEPIGIELAAVGQPCGSLAFVEL